MSILSGHARVAGIAGWPVTSSISRGCMGSGCSATGLTAPTCPCLSRPAEFGVAIRGLVAAGLGANVTIPHELAAFAICDEVDASAHRAGAVNTLVFREGKVFGSNTDGYGFIANVRAHGIDPTAGPALLLGAAVQHGR